MKILDTTKDKTRAVIEKILPISLYSIGCRQRRKTAIKDAKN
jgi:hypothetical protein